MRLLIIEDEIALCSSIAECLHMDNYEIDTCHDGLEALELCSTENYDLILLDLILPGMDGMDMIRVAQKNHRNLIFFSHIFNNRYYRQASASTKILMFSSPLSNHNFHLSCA